MSRVHEKQEISRLLFCHWIISMVSIENILFHM